MTTEEVLEAIVRDRKRLYAAIDASHRILDGAGRQRAAAGAEEGDRRSRSCQLRSRGLTSL